jgi:MFS family permease
VIIVFRDAGTNTSTVTVTVAAGFVGLLSVANMAGRFIWSSISDFIGRKPTYMMYLGVGIVLYLLLATVGSSSTALFVLVSVVIISYYGGGFATVPAYLRDLFGTYQVGAIHGRLLTAWSTAGILGPLIINRVLDPQGTPGELVASDYRPALCHHGRHPGDRVRRDLLILEAESFRAHDGRPDHQIARSRAGRSRR